MLGHAVMWGYLDVNAASRVRLPRPAWTEEETIQALSGAEVERLLDGAPPEYHPLFLTAVSTGIRLGELRALRSRGTAAACAPVGHGVRGVPAAEDARLRAADPDRATSPCCPTGASDGVAIQGRRRPDLPERKRPSPRRAQPCEPALPPDAQEGGTPQGAVPRPTACVRDVAVGRGRSRDGRVEAPRSRQREDDARHVLTRHSRTPWTAPPKRWKERSISRFRPSHTGWRRDAEPSSCPPIRRRLGL
jgi:hypothetical protein